MATLSIVIPIRNEEDHLAACLDAIAAQTEMPDEVIVVDNNSTDHSVEIARRYPFVGVVKESKQGIAHARNAGFNAVTSDIIGRIDADSRLPRDWVRAMRRFLETHPDNLLTGGSYFYDLKLPRLFGFLQGQVAFRANRFIMGHYIAWGSNMAFRRELWLAVRDELHNDPDIHEDMDLSMHLHNAGYQITYHAGLKVGVDSRLFSPKRDTRRKHLAYLKMWPRTLYKHRLKRAWLGWVGVYIVYASYHPLFVVNWLAGKLKS